MCGGRLLHIPDEAAYDAAEIARGALQTGKCIGLLSDNKVDTLLWSCLDPDAIFGSIWVLTRLFVVSLMLLVVILNRLCVGQLEVSLRDDVDKLL